MNYKINFYGVYGKICKFKKFGKYNLSKKMNNMIF